MNDWTYTEFLAFLLLHAANDDLEVGKKEMKLIESICGAEAIETVSEVMEELNDAQQLDLLLSYQERYFANEESKKQIYADMKEVYMADHNFSIMEQNSFRMLKKIIG
jgi:uncharacterized tellurite resistance protein B-like protein